MLRTYSSAPQIPARNPVVPSPGINENALLVSTWEPLQQGDDLWDAPIVLTPKKASKISAWDADIAVSSDIEKATLHCRHKPSRKPKLAGVDVLNPSSAAAERERAISLMRARGSAPVIASICTMHGLTTAGHVIITRGLDALLAGQINPLAAAVYIGTYAGLYAASAAAQGTRSVLEGRWAQNSYRAFHAETVRLNSGRLDLWADEGRREDLAAMLGVNAQGVIAASTAQLSQLVSAITGFAMSVGQLSLMLNPLIGAAAVASGLLSLAYIRAMEPGLKARRAAVEEETEALRALNGQAAENLLLPNTHSRRVWSERFRDQLCQHERAEGAQTNFEMLREVGVSLLMSAPMGISLGYVAMSDVASAIRAFENVMPAYRLLERFESAVHVGLGLHEVNTNLDYLARSTSGRSSEAWSHRLRRAAIHAGDFAVSLEGVPIAFDAVRTNPELLTQPGRWTIRAPNGTGKSTLLMALALYLAPQHEVHLLPAHSNVATEDGGPGSTGQVKAQQFEDIDRNVAPIARVILLDEWNGNLDRANTQRLSAMIARWSQRCAVIEVLNREDDEGAA